MYIGAIVIGGTKAFIVCRHGEKRFGTRGDTTKTKGGITDTNLGLGDNN